MTVRALLVALALAFPTGGPATAGSAPGLSVWPARLALAPGDTAVLHVANGGRRAAVIELRVAGFTLDLRGTPRLVAASGGTRLVALRPARLVVPAGGAGRFAVRARRAGGVSPGDHPALVLLTARSAGGAGVGVRVRIGVTVEVRAPGTVRRLVELTRARVRARTLTLAAWNRGNVAERVTRGAIAVRVLRRGRLLAVLRPRPRELLPHSRGLVEFVLPHGLRGRARILVRAPHLPLRTRSFPVSL